MRFSWQVYWGGLPLPLLPPSLSELSALTCPSRLQGTAHGFIVLPKPLRHDKAVIFEGAVLHASAYASMLLSPSHPPSPLPLSINLFSVCFSIVVL